MAEDHVFASIDRLTRVMPADIAGVPEVIYHVTGYAVCSCC